ncbi:hypothetical protein ACFY00_30560 [Kitasatospora sp. NPDC001540]|uniref:hypothetical protein n=1 Tax=Kitasatospora sp. NPDC001540 TaxID=3364014 RepID=UPI0036C50302
MFRLIPTHLWESTQRRLGHAEGILAAQAVGWQAPLPPVNGDRADVLRHVDAAVRDEAVCRATDFAERFLDEHSALGLALAERWTGFPDGTAVYCLGGGYWLHYNPGRTKLHTSRAYRFREPEEICLITGTSKRETEPITSLAVLLERLGGDYIDYRADRADAAVAPIFG